MATNYFNQLFSPLPQQALSAQLPSMQPINDALAANAMKPAPAPAPAAGASQHHGLLREGSPVRNFLGMVGDALLVANGGQPIYHQHQQQQQMRSALQNFLTDPQGAIANLMQVDPVSGIDLYKAAHPPSETPLEVKLLNYKTAHPESAKALDQIIQAMHPGMSTPVIMPDDVTGIETPGGGNSLPTVASPEEAAKLPPGTRFKLPDGRIGTVPGGATGSTPSPTFPR